jgi:hypothetical protein
MSSLPGKTLYASGFNPRNIPGCALWLDAADRNTFTLTGSNISQWNDKSGNGRNATQSTAGNRPTYNSTSNFVNFTRTSSQFMNLPDSTLPSGNSSYAYFVVCTWYQLADGHGIIGGGNYGTTNQVFAARSINTTGQVVTYWWGNDLTSSNNAYSANTPVLLDFMYTAGSTRSIVVNGTINVSDTPGTRSQGTGNNTIGRTYPALSEFLNGNIQEIVVYSNALTTSERQQVEGYLASKWGLTSGLPATHPFKLYPVYTRPFQPVDISGCTLWLDAADRATFTFSGANITQWNDKSGNANHAFNSTGTLLPTLGTNSVSLPAVDFNSAYLMNNNAFGLSNMSVFVVGEERTTNASNVYSGIVIFKGITGGPNAGTTEDYAQTNAILIATPNTTETTTCIQVYSQLPPFPQLSGSGGNGYWTYRLYEVLIRTGTASEIFLNGTSNASYTLKNRSGNSAGYLLSARQFNGSFTVGRLKHSEVLSYDRVLSTSERQQVEGYLATKWGLRGNIPATHPFKLFPPLTPVFTPVQISGCALWLDAADATTLTLSGSSVTTWSDKSGNGNNATSGGSSTPTYSNSSVVFDGNGYYNTAYSAALANETFFIVYKWTTISADAVFISGTQTFQRIFYVSPSLSRWLYLGGQASWGRWNTTALTSNISYLAEFSWNGSSLTPLLYLNGSNLSITGTTGTVTSFSGTPTTSRIGSGIVGSINEVIGFNTTLTTPQRQAVEGYLASKWGLLDSLPSTHPYKKIRP